MTTYNEESRAKIYEQYPQKPREQKRIGGLIENWSLVPFNGDDKKLVIVGSLSGDNYWDKGPIRTSLIMSINEDETEAETLNTIYKLGVKASA
ncbi:predicted ORF [Xanthomonas phage XacN1]|nr:predicted ORF [Xanthomonas phage XacN1]BBA65697.1 predicted ORF [Xanthomonas phage XacN1]